MNPPQSSVVNNCFYSIPNTNPIKILHSPQRISVMLFLEKIHYCLSTHKVINWIVSIIFFLVFLVNSISRIFLTGRRLDSKFFKRDLIFYICGMRPEVLVPQDIVMGLSIACVSLAAVIIFFLFAFTIKKRYYPLFMNLFVIVWFYFMPLTMFLHINIFMQGYALVDYRFDQQSNQKYGITPIISASIIIHIITMFLCALCFPIFSETPRDIVHPFISISRFNTNILLPYYFLYMHLSGFYYDFNLLRFAFRIILGVVVLTVHIYSPFYSHRVMNSMLMFVLLSEVVCTSIYVSMNDLDSTYNPQKYNPNDDNAFMDTRFKIILFSLPPILAISFIYFFLIFQHSSKKDRIHQIKNQYISGELLKVHRFLKHLKFVNIQHCNMKEIIKTAIGLKYPQTNQIIQYLATCDKYTRSIIDVYYLWTSINIIDLEINHEISVPMLKMAEKYENKIKDLEKEFWTNVYLSNITKLPKIAAKLNLTYGLRYLNIDDASKLCPKLLKSEKVNNVLVSEIKSSRKISLIKKYFYSCSLVDLFILFVFIAVVIGHSLFLTTSKQRWPLINNCITFIQFTKDFMDYEVSLWGHYNQNGTIDDNANLTSSNISLNKLINSFQNLKEMTKKDETIAALFDYIYLNQTFESRFQNFLDKIQVFYINIPKNHETSFFVDDQAIHDTFVDIVFLLDTSLVNLHIIFDEIVSSKTKYKTIYSFFAPTALILIFIIAVIVNFVILKKKCQQFYKGFAIIRKPVLKNYETEPSKGTYQFRRKHTFSYVLTYPVTTISIVLAFLNVCFQLLLLQINESHDQYNYELIDTTVDGLANVQSVPLWLVTSILFRNTTFNSFSSSAIDFLSQAPKLKEYKYLIPNRIFTLYGDYIYKNNPRVLYGEWKQVYIEIESNINLKSETFDYLVGFFVRRFSAFFILSFIIFILFMIIQNKLNFFMKGESRTGEYILKQFAFNFDQHNQQKKKRKQSYISSNDNFNMAEKRSQNEKRNKRNKKYKIEDDQKEDKFFKYKKEKSENEDEISLEEIYYDDDHSSDYHIDSNTEQTNNEINDENQYKIVQQKKVKKVEKDKYWPFIIEPFDQSLMPLHFIVVNPKLKVVFCTKKSSNKVGQTLKQGRLSQFLNKKMKELNIKCKIDEEVVWKIPETNVQAIPLLKFNDKENKFEVNYMVVLSIDDSDFRIDQYQNEYNMLFKSVYPEFVKEAKLPAQIATKQNYRMVLIIKLDGFDTDFTNNNNNNLQKKENNLNLNLAAIRIRRLVSQSLVQKLEEYPFIYRIRETSSEIIITFDQENDKIAWNIFQFGSTVANSVFNDIKLLKSSLLSKMNDIDSISDLPFVATALLYKAKVQDLFVADEKMGFVDFVGDCIYEAEKILKYCVPFHFNYVSMIPRDPKPKFTTKIKCFTLYDSGNEMKYDLYIGV